MPIPSLPFRVAIVTAAMAFAVLVGAQTPAPARGELLYQTHCVACHDRQVHWRDRKLVGDWTGLAAEVRRWQANLGLAWSDDTIEEVTRYLNDTIYRFPDRSRTRAG